MQIVCAAIELNEPGEHRVQVDMPVVAAKVPAGQDVPTDAPAGQNWPVGQAAETEESPVVAQVGPAVQATQKDRPRMF